MLSHLCIENQYCESHGQENASIHGISVGTYVTIMVAT